MHNIKNHTYDYDKLVVGSDISALVYAYVNRLPLVLVSPNEPSEFDFLPSDVDVSRLDLTSEYITLRTANNEDL